LCVAFVFAVGAAFASGHILSLMGQPESLIPICLGCNILGLLAMPPTWLCYALATVLSSQGLLSFVFHANTITVLLRTVLTYVMLRFTGMGYLSFPSAAIISAWIKLVLFLAYIVQTGKQADVWKMPPLTPNDGHEKGESATSSESIRAKYLHYALPPLVGQSVETVAVELMLVFAGWTADPEITISAQGLLMHLASFLRGFMEISGRPAVIRVSYCVGRQDIDGIRHAVLVSLKLGGLCCCLGTLALHMWSSQVIRVFSNNSDLIDKALRATWAMVATLPTWAVLTCLNSILRGAGQAITGSLVGLAVAVTMGIPASYALGVPLGMGLTGIWLGNAIALVVAVLVTGWVLYRVDWAVVMRTV